MLKIEHVRHDAEQLSQVWLIVTNILEEGQVETHVLLYKIVYEGHDIHKVLEFMHVRQVDEQLMQVKFITKV